MPDSDVYPTGLSLPEPNRLQIVWSDGATLEYRAKQLRDACPCATCREKTTAAALEPLTLPILSAGEQQPLRISGMRPVGNYAYCIAFSDGHDTGIYTLAALRELGRAAG